MSDEKPSVFRVKRIWVPISIGILLLYLVFPLIVGFLQLGPDLRGPKFFHQEHHMLLYTIGYEFMVNEKPRIPYNADERLWYYVLNKDKRR